MSNHPDFRAWLRRRRLERGLTQDDLGELVGYAGQTIRKIEGGQRRASPQLALRLAQVLEIAPDQHAAWMAAANDEAEETIPTPPATNIESLRTPLPSPGLPTYLTPFVGRQQEQAGLTMLLRRPECRLITILGPGGVGKTRFAIETARSAPGFPDGIAFVSLASISTPEAIVPAIADSLGFIFSGASDLLGQLLIHLQNQHSLLILDNLEHLLDMSGATLEIIGRLLAQAPGVVALVTSRERLKLAGEWVFEIGGLPVGSQHATAEPSSDPALLLFAEHAQRADHSFQLTLENQEAVASICRLVDGFPLGIELAAAWVRMLSLEEIRQELTHSLDTTHPSPGMLPSRHHSLHSVVDHSWQRLSDEEQRVLRRLSVFRGGFTREAAAQVAQAGLGVLANLVDKSLLRRGGGGRYDLHEIIRQYSELRQQDAPDDIASTRDRHARYYLQLLIEREWKLKGAEQVATTAEISTEIDNIRVAWQWALRQQWLPILEQASEVLYWFFECRSWHQEGVTVFAQAAERLRSLHKVGNPGRSLGRILGHYGYLSARVGSARQASDVLTESQRLLADGSDPDGLAQTLALLGLLANWGGDYVRARAALQEAIALTIPTNNRWGRTMAQITLAMVTHSTGEYHEAELQFRQALANLRELGSPHALLWCLSTGTLTLIALGKYQEARQFLHECITLSHLSHDRYGLGIALHHLGFAALQEQSGAEAIERFREALPHLKATVSWETAKTLNDLAAAFWLVGNIEEARATSYEALAMALTFHAIPDALQSIAGLARYLAHTGENHLALALAARVLIDPASTSEGRKLAYEIAQTVRPTLSAEAVAQAETQAQNWPLEVIRAAIPPKNKPADE